MILFPYSTETVITRWPVANIAIIAACTLTSFLVFLGVIPDAGFEALVLDGWNPLGLLGHMLLHAGLGHLFFNMVGLWVFGNAACETTGSLRYLGMFVGTGVLAAVLHNLFDGDPAIGASGAINGIIGFYLVLFPTNRISCFYWVLFRAGVIDIAGYWLIGFWFLGDAFGAGFRPDAGIAYWAHIGGLLSGIGLGIAYDLLGWSKLQDYDNPSLVDLLIRRKPAPSVIVRARTRDELIRAHRDAVAAAEPRAEAEPVELVAPCPHCGRELRLLVQAVAQRVTCPDCQGPIELEP